MTLSQMAKELSTAARHGPWMRMMPEGGNVILPEVGDRCAHFASQNGQSLLKKDVFCKFATLSVSFPPQPHQTFGG